MLFPTTRSGTGKRALGRRMRTCDLNVSILIRIVVTGSGSDRIKDQLPTIIQELWDPTSFGLQRTDEQFTNMNHRTFTFTIMTGAI